MPVADVAPGPMGWWRNDTDAVFKTTLIEKTVIGEMEDLAPERMTTLAPADYDADLAASIKSKLQADDGWGMWCLEEIAFDSDLGALWAQIIGSCVASSHIMLLGSRSIHEIVLKNDKEETLGDVVKGVDSCMPYGPYSYRVGRDAGGINGNGDGSFCAAQIKGTMKHGYLPCSTDGLSGRFPEPDSESTYRAWGASNRYVSPFYAAGEKFDLVESVQVNDADEARRLLVEEYKPLQICSGWGFGPSHFDDKYGIWIYKRQGSWAHSMQIIGFMLIKGAWFVVVRNQWGRGAHKDPGRGVPKGCFIIPFELFARWIKDSVTMSIGELQQRKPELVLPW